jgi:hypothetical protein
MSLSASPSRSQLIYAMMYGLSVARSIHYEKVTALAKPEEVMEERSLVFSKHMPEEKETCTTPASNTSNVRTWAFSCRASTISTTLDTFLPQSC